MSSPTYEDVRQAFLYHRRKNGRWKTMKLLVTHGAPEDSPDLESVPEISWPALFAALVGEAAGVSVLGNRVAGCWRAESYCSPNTSHV